MKPAHPDDFDLAAYLFAGFALCFVLTIVSSIAFVLIDVIIRVLSKLD